MKSAIFAFLVVTSLIGQVLPPGVQSNPLFFDGSERCGDDQTPASKILSTFQAGTFQQLLIGFSRDGVNWCPVFIKTGINLRDPDIIKVDSTYYISASGGPGADWFCYSSADGKHWDAGTAIDTSGGGLAPTNVWAPKWFIDTDDSIHVLSGISENSQTSFQIYEQNPSGTGDVCARTWSNPVAITITSEGSAIDSRIVCIDSTGVLCTAGSVSPTYHMFYNSFPGDQKIWLATSSTLTGTYTITESGNWAGWGTGVLEGPQLVLQGMDSWRMYFDSVGAGGSLTTGQINYSDCTNGLSCFTGTPTWTTPKPLPTVPFQAKHGAIYQYP